MYWFKKTLRVIITSLVVIIISLFLLEISYRYQWVDFYKTEWTYNNKDISKSPNQDKVLIFGDSFSAQPNSWVNILNSESNSKTFYNASLPGVGPETYRLIAKRRINQIKPNLIIIQLYVGNDIYDLYKPISWSTHSLSRNLFWSASNKFRILNYFNYKAGQVSQDVVQISNPKSKTEFSPELYSARTKMYIDADPQYPSSTIQLTTENLAQFQNVIHCLKDIKSTAADDVQIKIVLIPHCAQISSYYQNNFALLGAKGLDKIETNNIWKTTLENAGFYVIDPLHNFQKVDTNSSRIYFDNDPHLTDFGQQILAEVVKQEL